MCRAPFWGLFAIFALLNANALLFINNVSFIDTALGQTSATAKVTLLWPVASAVSRVAAGGLSDRFERNCAFDIFYYRADGCEAPSTHPHTAPPRAPGLAL